MGRMMVRRSITVGNPLEATASIIRPIAVSTPEVENVILAPSMATAASIETPTQKIKTTRVLPDDGLSLTDFLTPRDPTISTSGVRITTKK